MNQKEIYSSLISFLINEEHFINESYDIDLQFREEKIVYDITIETIWEALDKKDG
jgi:hypothetical protein